MSSKQMSNEHATRMPSAGMVDLKLEVVAIPVADVRAPDNAAKDAAGHLQGASR